MTVEFINDKEWGIDKEAFGPLIKKLQKSVDLFEGILNVVFVNDAYIRSLNKTYRGKDEPTDVLSFNYLDDDHDSKLTGEVYISIETAKRQAKEYKHSLQDELGKLFIHGVLHIHGYDHEEEEDFAAMNAIENSVLK